MEPCPNCERTMRLIPYRYDAASNTFKRCNDTDISGGLLDHYTWLCDNCHARVTHKPLELRDLVRQAISR